MTSVWLETEGQADPPFALCVQDVLAQIDLIPLCRQCRASFSVMVRHDNQSASTFLLKWREPPPPPSQGGPGRPGLTPPASWVQDVRPNCAWTSFLYFMQSYSRKILSLARLSHSFLSFAVGLLYFPFVGLIFTTAGSGFVSSFLLPPFWPIGVLQSLHTSPGAFLFTNTTFHWQHLLMRPS
jgi:hypothetical protein